MAGKQSPIIYPMTVPTLTPSIILTILFLSTSSLHLYRMIKFRRPIYSYLFAFSFVRLLLFIVRTAWSTIYHSITLNIITRVLLVGGFFIIIEALYTLLTDWLIITLIGETSTSNYNHNNEEGDAIIPKFTKYTIKFIKFFVLIILSIINIIGEIIEFDDSGRLIGQVFIKASSLASVLYIGGALMLIELAYRIFITFSDPGDPIKRIEWGFYIFEILPELILLIVFGGVILEEAHHDQTYKFTKNE
ncbi:15796_t:CDS:2 [Entrophospora sp. SA101]|nr:15796_t:CDS:2 [Entrophospora sp. SA101]